MKALKFKEAHDFLDEEKDTQKLAIEKLEELESAMKQTSVLDALMQGQGSEALKERYESEHMPVVEKAKSSSESCSERVESIKSDMSDLDREDAVWKEEVLSVDVPNGYTAYEEAVEESVKDIQGILATVEDFKEVAALPKFQMNAELKVAEVGRKHAQDTAEKLLGLDEDHSSKALEIEEKVEGVSGKAGNISV
ncbi:T7SS effector LXG polymorphic toxin [Bacillus sp. FSL W7-1360]